MTTRSKADRKKQFVRIGAMAVAGVMLLSFVLAVIINQ